MRASLILVLALASCAAPQPQGVVAVHKPGLENAHWIADRVLSGAQPEGDAAFRELAALGVKTVISVDGATPDLESAHRHGLKYVHVPIGYDGVPVDRAMELAKAIQELPGPVYVHCHHGQHRGPAATVVACVIAGRMTNEQAVAAMTTMGTGAQYIGLWDSAKQARPADPKTLRNLKAEFREVAPVPPFAAAMVSLDEAYERLVAKETKDRAHEALRMKEISFEIMRTEDFKSRPEDFRRWMKATFDASARVETLLRENAPTDQALAALKKSCTDCHKPYRNAVKPK